MPGTGIPENVWVQLGIAAPFIALLIYLLRQANQERKDLTDKFVTAMTTTVTSNTHATTGLKEAINEWRAGNQDEHGRIVDALGRLERK